MSSTTELNPTFVAIFRPNGSENRDKSFLNPWRVLPAAGLIGVCAASALTEAPSGEGAITCPFRLVTGGWCPGCGGTRALRHLMHGDVALSLSLNPFLVIVLAQAIAISAWFAKTPEKAREWFGANYLRFVFANMAIGGTIWAIRLAVGHITAPFEVDPPIFELLSAVF